MANYNQNSFITGMASGIGDTGAIPADAEGNSWAQGYLAGQALRAFLYAKREPIAYLYGHVAESTVTYNGVELPELPEIDVGNCSYFMIFLSNDYGSYCLKSLNEFECTYEDNPTLIIKPVSRLRELTEAEAEAGTWGYYVSSGGDDEWGFDELVWTNVDVLNEDGTLYLAASEPVRTYIDPDVTIDGVGYVGAVLPALPEWDKETYPYAVISVNSPIEYELKVLSSNDWQKVEGVELFYNAGGYQIYATSKLVSSTSYGVWTYKSEGEGVYLSASSVAVWSNHDIMNEDGSLFLSASVPVPVYE